MHSKRWTIFFLWLSLISGGWAQSTSARVRQGNRQYEEKNYEQALQQYSEALAADPNRGEIRYNLGNTLHRLGKHQEAVTELKKAAGSSSPSLQPLAHYNLGNVLYQSGDYQGAVREYSSALKSNAADKDAKHNLEVALRKLQEEQQKQSQDKKEKSEEKDKQNDQQKQQGKNDPQDKNQPQGKDQEKQDPSKEKDGKDPKQQPSDANQEKQSPASEQKQNPSPQSWKNIGPKEAEQILKAMEAKEGQELQRQLQLVRQKQGKERDW